MDDVRLIDETCDPYRLLASIRRKLTAQQYRTIRGQLRAVDVDGAVRGMIRLTDGEKHET